MLMKKTCIVTGVHLQRNKLTHNVTEEPRSNKLKNKESNLFT